MMLLPVGASLKPEAALRRMREYIVDAQGVTDASSENGVTASSPAPFAHSLARSRTLGEIS
jgi:hypothetical protein